MQQNFCKGTLEKEVKKLTHYETEHWLNLMIQIVPDFKKMADTRSIWKLIMKLIMKKCISL